MAAEGFYAGTSRICVLRGVEGGCFGVDGDEGVGGEVEVGVFRGVEGGHG